MISKGSLPLLSFPLSKVVPDNFFPGKNKLSFNQRRNLSLKKKVGFLVVFTTMTFHYQWPSQPNSPFLPEFSQSLPSDKGGTRNSQSISVTKHGNQIKLLKCISSNKERPKLLFNDLLLLGWMRIEYLESRFHGNGLHCHEVEEEEVETPAPQFSVPPSVFSRFFLDQ